MKLKVLSVQVRAAHVSDAHVSSASTCGLVTVDGRACVGAVGAGSGLEPVRKRAMSYRCYNPVRVTEYLPIQRESPSIC